MCTIASRVAQGIGRESWKPDHYRIKARVPNADGSADMIDVIYLEDERSAHPAQANRSGCLWTPRPKA